MTDPITREEQSRTARAILARHLTFIRPPLSEGDRDELLDAGLVYEDELVSVEPVAHGGSEETRWTYVGDRWGVDYLCGRPILVPECDALKFPFTRLQDVERRFAGAILLVELVSNRSADDQAVAELRRKPPWSLSFEQAEREDAERLAKQSGA